MNYRQQFLAYNAQTSPAPLLIEVQRAEGIYLYTPEGKKIIDFISGISVSSIGHSNTMVKEAVKKQLDLYTHVMVYGEMVQAPQVILAKKIIELLPKNFESVYLVNSGAEAIDGAMKLCKRATGRKKLIAFYESYHGSTHGPLSLMGSDEYKKGYGPLLPEVEFIHFNSIEDLKKIDEHTAGVFVEPVQAEAGIRLPKNNYLQELQKRCNTVGAILVADEIQTGCGRLGTLFAFEKYGFIPDVLVLAKALGAGFPIGAFISSHKIMNNLMQEPVLGHITTFGGHPVIAAAATAGLNFLTEHIQLNEVEEKGNLIKELLHHSLIKDIRGEGLLLCVEFENFEINKKIIDRCIEKGLLTDWFLHHPQSLRIAPPLIISKEEIRCACSIIMDAINEIHSELN